MLQEWDGRAPRLDEGAWVHETAVVIGEVTLGRDVSVWPCAVLRGDMGAIEIGDESNIQDGAVCHDTGGLSVTRLGRRVTVGHRAVLHGCIVEDECLIGMGAIVLDNAVIGAGSVVGAGALVPAGRVIPAGSLVLGSPAKVVRPCTDRERAMIENGWRTYLVECRRWRSHGGAAGLPRIGVRAG